MKLNNLLVTVSITMMLGWATIGCAEYNIDEVHYRSVMNSVGAVSLGPRIDRKEFEYVVAETLAGWDKAFPGVFDMAEVEVEFLMAPIAVVFTPDTIMCPNSALDQDGDEIPRCDGLWFPGYKYLFVRYYNDKALRCTAVSHELSHMLSLIFFNHTDFNHENEVVWKNIVGQIQGGCQ